MEPLRNVNGQLYRLAVLESDPAKLPMRIDDARKAIRWRVCELWDLGAIDTCERSQLDAASYFLGLLRMIAAKKKPGEIGLLCRGSWQTRSLAKRVAETTIACPLFTSHQSSGAGKLRAA
jgi:hypothetical protein